jgi:hypothetical protein
MSRIPASASTLTSISRLLLVLVAFVALSSAGMLVAQTQPVKPRVNTQIKPQEVPVRPATTTTGEQDSSSGQQSYYAGLTGMAIAADGEIRSLQLFYQNRDVRIRGCGAKLADLPVLEWLYRDRQAAEFVTNDGCLSSINLSR